MRAQLLTRLKYSGKWGVSNPVGSFIYAQRARLMPLPVISTPWKRIAIDIVGPLPRTKRGHKYLLTIMDFGTRYPEAIPLKKTDAETVCDKLLEVFSRFGILEELLSDNGTNFLLQQMKGYPCR